jgi:hypothetical protein
MYKPVNIFKIDIFHDLNTLIYTCNMHMRKLKNVLKQMNKEIMYAYSRVSIARGCRARQYSLFCLAKKICCRARQNEHCRARTWRLSNQIGAVLCPAAKGFQCPVLFQLRRSCGVPVILSIQNEE